MKCRTPLFLGLETDEILRIEETSRVGTVIGAAGLTCTGRCLRKRTKQNPRAVHQPDTFAWTRAWSECPAHPDRTFIQMRQEFRSDDAEDEICARAKRTNGNEDHDGSVMYR